MMRRILMNNISVRINNTDTQDNANGLYIRILETDEITDIYNEHIVTDFPASEVKPLSQMLRKREQGQYFVYGMFEDNGELAGYAYFIKCSNKELSMINVNIKATHILTKYMVKTFKKRNRGYIMNVASSAGLLPGGPYMSTYYATKSYVTSLTSAINEELREAKSRVHICMLCPGPVNTNFNNVANVTFALPGISATYCASYALRQMFRGKVTIVPTLMMKLGTTVAKCVPRQMVTAITARQQKKKIM
jgi:uncharacterized protein